MGSSITIWHHCIAGWAVASQLANKREGVPVGAWAGQAMGTTGQASKQQDKKERVRQEKGHGVNVSAA